MQYAFHLSLWIHLPELHRTSRGPLIREMCVKVVGAPRPCRSTLQKARTRQHRSFSARAAFVVHASTIGLPYQRSCKRVSRRFCFSVRDVSADFQTLYPIWVCDPGVFTRRCFVQPERLSQLYYPIAGDEMRLGLLVQRLKAGGSRTRRFLG